MMRASSLLMLLATTAVAAGCGGKKPPEEPAPQPAPAPTPAPTPPPDASEDSVRIKREQEAQRLEQMRKAVAADLAAMINFDYDQALVRSADESTLDRKAAVLQANPNVKMTISGHADERGSDEYNLALGNRRAGAAKRYLQNKGVDGSRLDVVSYGEERPLNPGHDEAAYAQNRRDEFQVTAGGDQLVAPQ